MLSRVWKFIRNPIKIAKRRFGVWMQPYKYGGVKNYNAEKYWTDRHSEYGFDLRGVGSTVLTNQQNIETYRMAKETFLAVCRSEMIDFQSASMLDIGCGTGFYAKIFAENKGEKYLGVDIANTLLPKIRQEFPNFRFEKSDISTHPLLEMFDLIIMVDVTQHITNEEKFSYAMQNIRTHLSRNGVFIVTSWLSSSARSSFYETSRPLERYISEFHGYHFSKPLPFRDKFIFSIRKQV